MLGGFLDDIVPHDVSQQAVGFDEVHQISCISMGTNPAAVSSGACGALGPRWSWGPLGDMVRALPHNVPQKTMGFDVVHHSGGYFGVVIAVHHRPALAGPGVMRRAGSSLTLISLEPLGSRRPWGARGTMRGVEWTLHVLLYLCLEQLSAVLCVLCVGHQSPGETGRAHGSRRARWARGARVANMLEVVLDLFKSVTVTTVDPLSGGTCWSRRPRETGRSSGSLRPCNTRVSWVRSLISRKTWSPRGSWGSWNTSHPVLVHEDEDPMR